MGSNRKLMKGESQGNQRLVHRVKKQLRQEYGNIYVVHIIRQF